MAISDSFGSTSNTQQQSRQDRQTQQMNMRSEMSFGLSSRLSAFGGGGEYFDKMFTKYEEKIKQLNNHVKGDERYSIHKLIKTSAGLNYSGIVLGLKSGDMGIAHVLMIEKTGDYPNNLVENIGGVRYDILRTPGDALDNKYIFQSQKLVADAYNLRTDDIVVVDGTLVPSEFNVENDTSLHDLFINSINALDAEINIRKKTYTGIDISSIINTNRAGKFVVNMYFNSNEVSVLNEVDMPVRQDVCVTLSYKFGSNFNDRSVNQGNDSIDIVKTFGYIDFQWVNSNTNNGMPRSQKFVPNFVITRIETNNIPTPDIALLAISSVLAINEDMNWMQAFRSTPIKKGEIDFNDIGALNIEGNVENNPHGFGTRVDTKSKEFTLSVLNTLVTNLVYPNIMISLDVGQASPDTWYENVFYFASRGDTPEANVLILNSLINMTKANIDTNIPIFSPTVNKIHSGYYKTKDGIRDLRNLTSYLSISNFAAETGQDPKIISEYTNSLYATSIPAEIRASERKKFIDNMSNNTAVYKQFYTRLTFTNAFLSTLAMSLKSVGFSPVFGNMLANNDMLFRRATADFSNSVIGNDVRIISNTNSFGAFYAPQGYNRTYG